MMHFVSSILKSSPVLLVFGYRVIIKNDIVLIVVPKLKITPLQIIKILNWLYEEGFIDNPNKEVLVKDNIKNFKTD